MFEALYVSWQPRIRRLQHQDHDIHFHFLHRCRFRLILPSFPWFDSERLRAGHRSIGPYNCTVRSPTGKNRMAGLAVEGKAQTTGLYKDPVEFLASLDADLASYYQQVRIFIPQ